MRRYLPVLSLFLLSPLVAEILFGATPLSRLYTIVLARPLYGGGAVLVRELARRRDAGWARVALLGAAYAVVEEGLALESMFNPDLFDAGKLGARALGVNWVWCEWTVGYHVVVSMTVPILLAETLFPERRREPWLGRIGTTVAGALAALGALALGAIFRNFVAPAFRLDAAHTAVAAVLALLVAAVALFVPRRPEAPAHAPVTRPAPSPWLVGVTVATAAAAWFGLLHLPAPLREGALVLAPMLVALVVAGTAMSLLRAWSAPGRAWTDVHRIAAAIGVVAVIALYGFFFVTAAVRTDRIFQGAASAVALALLALFARARARVDAPETPPL